MQEARYVLSVYYDARVPTDDRGGVVRWEQRRVVRDGAEEAYKATSRWSSYVADDGRGPARYQVSARRTLKRRADTLCDILANVEGLSWKVVGFAFGADARHVAYWGERTVGGIVTCAPLVTTRPAAIAAAQAFAEKLATFASTSDKQVQVPAADERPGEQSLTTEGRSDGNEEATGRPAGKQSRKRRGRSARRR